MSTEWIAADWPAAPNIVAGSTIRHGGVSQGVYGTMNLGAHVGDDPAAVVENRRRFVSMCGLDNEPEWLNQVHGVNVRVSGDDTAADADAAIGCDPGESVAVLTADCLPVLLCSLDGAEFAAIHCGWRGLAAGIIGITVSQMSTAPDSLMAWFGPAISQSAFEVGGEVRGAFLSRDPAGEACFEPNSRGRWQADLYGLARQQLGAAGLTLVYGGGSCTYGDKDRFFSYRRDGQCGRMATFVSRKR